MITAVMPSHQHANSTKRARRAETPHAALIRQQQLAQRDTAALYDFTVLSYPLLRAAPMFHLGEVASASLPPTPELQRSPERTLEPAQRELVEEVQSLMVDISRTFVDATKVLAERSGRLRNLLKASRLAVFKLDFSARKRFTPTRPSVCLLCTKRKKTIALPCCRREENAKTVCYDCLERSAFVSSELGTRNEARCPFCKAAYPVYDPSALSPKKRKREE
jgi:hypothetical protein